MRLSAKADYALRASVELASHGDGPVKADTVARAQSIPLRFLEQILLELKHAGIVASQRGAEGGYRLARRPPANSTPVITSRARGGRYPPRAPPRAYPLPRLHPPRRGPAGKRARPSSRGPSLRGTRQRAAG